MANKLHDNFNEEFGGEEILLQEYNEALAKLEQLKLNNKFTLYSDPNFQPCMDSICDNINKIQGQKRKLFDSIEWKRAPEIFDKDQLRIFQGQIEPNDIKQGKLGDCYFLSALSSLSENDEQKKGEDYIRKLFHSDQINEFGIYSVWLNIFGEWRNVVLDDQFPCIKQGEKYIPVFSRANGDELWVLLLEKAYAKSYGNYLKIEAGDPAIALRDLTGAPYENMDDKTEDDFWKFIKDNDSKGYVLTCYSKSSEKSEQDNGLGIYSGHAYSMLNAQQVQSSKGQSCRIVQIRNPWGFGEWKGDWSDKSDLWTEQWKKTLNVVVKDDGAFWLSLTDFCKYFQGVGICKCSPDAKYNSIKPILTDNHTMGIVKLTVDQKTKTTITVNQMDDRKYQCEEYQYSVVRMFIGKAQQNDIQYVQGKFDNGRDVSMEVNLDVGDYYILVEIHWIQQIIQEIAISSYGDQHVKFSQVEGVELLDIQNIIIKSFAKTDPPKQRIKKYGNKSDISRRTISNFGLIYFYYQNDSSDNYLVDTIEMQSLKGYEICYPFLNSQKVNVYVPPGEERLVIYKYQPNPEGAMSYSIKNSQHQFLEQSDIKKINASDIEKGIIKQFDSGRFVVSQNKKVNERQTSSIHFLQAFTKVYGCERAITRCFDCLIGNKVKNWGKFLIVCSLIFLFCSICSCFLRAQFLDIVLFLLFIHYSLTDQLTKFKFRVMLVIMFFCLIVDQIWLMLYSPNWNVSSRKIDGGLETHIIAFDVIMAWICYSQKLLLFLTFWRCYVNYDTDNIKEGFMNVKNYLESKKPSTQITTITTANTQ